MLKPVLLSLGAVLMLLPAPTDAEAGHRRHFGFYPYDARYYYYHHPRRFHRRAPRTYYYERDRPIFDRYEPDYYEPRFNKRKQQRAKAPDKEKLKAPAKTVTKAVAKPETKPETTKPETKAEAKKAEAISCLKATGIVSDYGFGDVKAADCKGTVYTFDAARDGKKFTVKLNSVDGELTSVAKR